MHSNVEEYSVAGPRTHVEPTNRLPSKADKLDRYSDFSVSETGGVNK